MSLPKFVISRQSNPLKQLHRENAMPRTKLPVPDVAEAGPGLW